MANKRPTSTLAQRAEEALKPGGVNSPDLGTNSRNTHAIRIVNGQIVKGEGEGSHPNNREHGGSGSGAPEAGSNEGARELPAPTTTASYPSNPFTASSNILETIAQRFNYARETNRAGAWRQFQQDLMNASPFICPALIPYKDLISVVAEIEKEIKGSSANQAGKSNEELLADFLSGGAFLPTIPPPIPPEALDNPVTIANGDGGSPI